MAVNRSTPIWAPFFIRRNGINMSLECKRCQKLYDWAHPIRTGTTLDELLEFASIHEEGHILGRFDIKETTNDSPPE